MRMMMMMAMAMAMAMAAACGGVVDASLCDGGGTGGALPTQPAPDPLDAGGAKVGSCSIPPSPGVEVSAYACANTAGCPASACKEQRCTEPNGATPETLGCCVYYNCPRCHQDIDCQPDPSPGTCRTVFCVAGACVARKPVCL